ncbi:MAG: PAS domain S-box protein [Geobacteraceae bacterium]|nr:PAS domain S-box protein [Geobacteraceae bacterium]
MAPGNDQSVIAAIKKAEQTLTGEKEFSRCLLESMADGVVACDANGILALFNRSAREWHGLDLLGLPPDQWADHYDLFRTDGTTPLPAEEIPLARAFRGEIVRDAGMAIKAKGQPIRFILANGSVILDEAGQKLGAVVIMRDVTEFRRLEQELRKANEELEKRVEERTTELRESEQRYRMVFENSPVSIWEEDFSEVRHLFDNLRREGITDIEAYFDQHPEMVRHCAELAKIIDVNQAALALHGASIKEELIAGLVNTFTPESLVTFREELICLWNGVAKMTREAVVKTLAGESRFVTVYFSVCPGCETTLAKVIVSLADITSRKEAEEALMRLNAELDQRVRDRTAELEEKNRELERTNKLFVGRELRMVELKEQIRELEEQTTAVREKPEYE